MVIIFSITTISITAFRIVIFDKYTVYSIIAGIIILCSIISLISLIQVGDALLYILGRFWVLYIILYIILYAILCAMPYIILYIL